MKRKQKRLALIRREQTEERNAPERPRNSWLATTLVRNANETSAMLWRGGVPTFGGAMILPRTFEHSFLVPGPEELQ